MRERAAFVIVFASLVVTSLPQLVRLVREPRFKPVTVSVPGTAPVALVTRKEKDPALFVAYSLYPRRTKIYEGVAAYRNADPRTRPQTIVLCDYDSARLTSFAELREEEIVSSPRVMYGALETAPPGMFFVPFVASLEGGVSDRYVVEADFESDTPLTLTFFPFGITKTIPPRASFHDLVYEVFRRTDAGWLRVECAKPLRAAIWLVNLGTRDAVRVRLVTGARSGAIRCPSDDCVLRLVNFSDRPTVANGSIPIAAHDMVSLPMRGEVNVSGDGVYAFAGTRRGKMEIAWP